MIVRKITHHAKVNQKKGLRIQRWSLNQKLPPTGVSVKNDKCLWNAEIAQLVEQRIRNEPKIL